MNRLSELLKYVDRTTLGIEVAPNFNAAIRKSDGFPVLILDVFNTESLRETALKNPHIPNARIDEIEEVDIVGDASAIGSLTQAHGHNGNLNYIVSSHNFEHLPNPILFLQGCAEVLKAGGILSMAVPDCRACFDHFRYPTRLSDWLDAYHTDRKQPSPSTIFDASVSHAMYYVDGQRHTGCSLQTGNLDNFIPSRDVRLAYSNYLQHVEKIGTYKDTHCSVFFPETLELMLRDLRYLGLLELDVVEISPTIGFEFFIHLRKPTNLASVSDGPFYERRDALLPVVSANIGSAPYYNRTLRDVCNRKFRSIRGRIESSGKQILNRIIGVERYKRLRDWHRVKIRKRLI
jgi:predicted SAM-dependent methyltransferase